MSGAARAAGPDVTIVGGGLAGLAAAAALTTIGCRVQLFEVRSSLGGRASSFRDGATGELVDQCQHVGMACCTNLADFCARVGLSGDFRRDRTLRFVGPDGATSTLRGSRWLPAPLHLAPSFWRLKFLSASERLAIARAMWRLARRTKADSPGQPTIGQWLKQQGQSPRAMEMFWGVILNSALGEELDRASLAAARKVILDGFMASREAYELDIPRAPLSQLYGQQLERWLADRDVELELGTRVQQVDADAGIEITLGDGRRLLPDFVVLAVPWSKLPAIVSPRIAVQWPWLAAISQVVGAPITAVHLWFDRPIMEWPHAVLVGRLSQWVFRREAHANEPGPRHYYQVVISASRSLAGRDRDAVVAQVREELAAIWPAAAEAQLLAARVVTESQAVFSTVPGLEQIRPHQETAVSGVLVAGDWTATGWPGTMESAVRSGYLAAEAIARRTGRTQKFVVDDLPRGLLARMLLPR